MKVPIPDDYEGGFECVRVYWPTSTKWLAVLAGLLTTPMLGRFWDERTGTITEAQAIGREIWDLNIPFNSCDGDVVEPTIIYLPGDAVAGSCGGIVILEDGVGQVVTDIEMNADGTIRVYYGKCCYKDLSVTAVSGVVAPDTGDDPWLPSGGSAPDYSACGKADAVVKAIALVLQGTYDALTTVDHPWQILGNVENAVGYNLDNKWLAAITTAWLALAGLSAIDMFSGLDVSDFIGFAPSNIFSLVDQQASRCALEGLFADDSTGVPDADAYNAIKNALSTRNFVYGTMVDLAVSCLGRGNLDTIVKLGAANTDADCACPGAGINDPTGLWGDDWSYFYDFTQAELPEFISMGAGETWALGVGVYKLVDASTGYCKVNVRANLTQNGGQWNRAWFRFEVTPLFDYIGTSSRVATSQTVQYNKDSAEWHDTDPGGGGEITSYKYDLVEDLTLAGDVWLEFGVEGNANAAYRDQIVAYAVKIKAVAFAGSGTDPFA